MDKRERIKICDKCGLPEELDEIAYQAAAYRNDAYGVDYREAIKEVRSEIQHIISKLSN